jgi:hypothetical protein
MNKFLSSLIAIAATVAFSTTTQAAVLLPGNVIFPAGDTSATAPNSNGVVQNDNLIPFSIPITTFTSVGGNVQNRVVLSNNLNTMVFGPRIRDTFNIATAGFEIIGFRLDGYAGWDTDVGYRTDGLGDKGPSSVSRSADGDLLTFRYEDPLFIAGIAPGLQEESLFPYIITDAPSYSLIGSMTIFGLDTAETDNLLSVTIDGLAVPSPVPIPAAAWLFGTALIGFVGFSRRRKVS